MLEQSGFAAEALEVVKTVVAAFQTPDPSLTDQVSAMQERLRLMESDVRGKMNALMSGQPDGAKQVSDAVETLLSGQPLGELTMTMVRSMAQALESNQPELAKQLYTKLATAYVNHKNPQLAEATKNSVEMFQRRTAVVGQPFTVEGVTTEGAAFDWQKYKGKVVLIDFWATWCALPAGDAEHQTYPRPIPRSRLRSRRSQPG